MNKFETQPFSAFSNVPMSGEAQGYISRFFYVRERRRCGPGALEKTQGTDGMIRTGGSWLVYHEDLFVFLA